jgi:hypothetical protein
MRDSRPVASALILRTILICSADRIRNPPTVERKEYIPIESEGPNSTTGRSHPLRALPTCIDPYGQWEILATMVFCRAIQVCASSAALARSKRSSAPKLLLSFQLFSPSL